ncbi:branched-chain amino acid ABC transporter permease [Fodinicurvata halophila]|uniref:Branched-chain amino acid ABC transporter permease n=1 Tax=Fodinicurvata halophila TaxID=1419723 RepID=A0ABV8UMD8_9PROT
MMDKLKSPAWMALGGLLVLALLVGGAEAWLTGFERTVIGFAGINIILAVSLSFSNGLTGLFSLGHPAFMMLGGYTAAILTFPAVRKPTMLPGLPEFIANAELSLLPATLAGGVVAALAALVAGFPVLRLRGHYLAVATLGLIVVVQVLINNMDSITRGAIGLAGLPRLSNLWWIYGWAAVTLFVTWQLKHSSIGRALMSVRENELAAASIGVPRARLKLLAFTLGAFFAGIAGALWAHLVTNLTPTSFGIVMAFMIVVMVVLGGSGSLIGAALAAIALSVINEIARPIERAIDAYGLVQIITAAILIAVLLFRPQGLFGSGEPVARRARMPGQPPSKTSQEHRGGFPNETS